MSGPSCVNARDWSFIVVKNAETVNKMADANGHPVAPLRQAALGILVCGDLNRAFPRAKEYWVIDGAIAAQNMILAADGKGSGTEPAISTSGKHNSSLHYCLRLSG